MSHEIWQMTLLDIRSTLQLDTPSVWRTPFCTEESLHWPLQKGARSAHHRARTVHAVTRPTNRNTPRDRTTQSTMMTISISRKHNRPRRAHALLSRSSPGRSTSNVLPPWPIIFIVSSRGGGGGMFFEERRCDVRLFVLFDCRLMLYLTLSEIDCLHNCTTLIIYRPRLFEWVRVSAPFEDVFRLNSCIHNCYPRSLLSCFGLVHCYLQSPCVLLLSSFVAILFWPCSLLSAKPVCFVYHLLSSIFFELPLKWNGST